MARSLEQLQKQYIHSSAGKDGATKRRRGHGPMVMASGKPKDAGRTVKRLMHYVGAYKIHFVCVFLCLIISTVAASLGTYFLSPILNKIANAEVADNDFAGRIIGKLSESMMAVFGSGISSVMVYVIAGGVLLSAVYIISAGCTYAQSKIMLHISQNSIEKIRTDLFNKVQTLPLRYHDTRTTGEIMSRFTNDVDNIGTMLDTSIISVVSGTATLITTLAFMIYTNIPLTVITLIFIPIFTKGGMIIGAKSSKFYRGQQASLGAVNGYIEETVTGQKVVKVFNHEKDCTEEFGLLNSDLREKQFKAQFYGGVMGPIMGNLSKVSYAITAGIGGVLCALTYGGSIAPSSVMALTFGGLTVFVQYANQFSRPINEVSMQMTTVFSALAGAERVFNVMDEASEEPDGKDALDPKFKGFVELNNVTFGYNPDKVILKNISLYAKPGQKIAFVGSTGAGKTTITNLLNRFYDIDSGSITIDGINIKDIKRDTLRKNIAMVLQDTHLFTGTVMENIRYGRLDATDEEVIAAAKTASAHSFIKRLANGYDTMLEGDGANLSQGQRQLLNIARAALSRAPILVLDEATSSVDTRTEKLIEKGMDSLMTDRTTFVIAHRLSTVRNANAIMVLEQGEIIERGTHEELLEQKGRYYELYTGKAELD
ncbi:MAG: ABC transporter ATP-binding protein [Clostridia bacterium]|nr:ABC transporter ATP-binding protein [Clostridia bacterium]